MTKVAPFIESNLQLFWDSCSDSTDIVEFYCKSDNYDFIAESLILFKIRFLLVVYLVQEVWKLLKFLSHFTLIQAHHLIQV